jgi:hypothetical protein
MSNVDLLSVDAWFSADELSIENEYKSFVVQLLLGDVVKLKAGNTRFDCANEQFLRKSGECDCGNLQFELFMPLIKLMLLFPLANDPFVDEVGDGDAETGTKFELFTNDASVSLKKLI